MGARREVVSAVAERYRSARRAGKGRILDELCATTGWHRKHAVRALRQRETVTVLGQEAPRARRRRYGATIRCIDGAVGSIGSGVRQTAQGDDPDLVAGT